ncbi:hypothetical protein [Listeria sp. PSOL-1]|uniref:hypothetical protein n=1 Tax=Listeria sp. PSOL-1 TaxID=1844999 RepID=UPI0013D0BE6D|nr:hypothetical protein [Listeria sp. PSOL-1]
MTIVIVILLIAAIALFVLSFMQKSDSKNLETEIEEVASQLMYENYELKRRVTILEKASHIEKTELPTAHEDTQKELSPKIRELLKKQVITLYTSGITTEEIVEQSSLPQEEIEQIIKEYLKH